MDEDISLEAEVVELLIKKNLTIAAAESCTGGLLSARLINVPGISAVYLMGEITYSNEAKNQLLKVKKKTLEKYGAVSQQVAIQMAEGIRLKAKSNVAIAVTGIAGPGGGSDEKPVGLVYISCSTKDGTVVQEHRFCGNRNEIRELTVIWGLSLIKECIVNLT